MPEADLAAAEVVARKIVTAIAALRIDAAQHELLVSASVGVVAVAADNDYDENTLLAAADLAMYEAKEAGRDQYAVHNTAGGSQAPSSTGSTGHIASEPLCRTT